MAKKNCVNVSSKEFKDLQKETNVNSHILASKIKSWQELNNSDEYPDAIDLIFHAPELAEDKETVFYSGDKAFPVKESEWKSGLDKAILSHLSDKYKVISKAKGLKDKHSILHTYRDSSNRASQTKETRLATVKNLHTRLVKLNDRRAIGDVPPFVINKVSDTKEGVPNYTVEANPAYLEARWKQAKSRMNTEAEADTEINPAPKFAAKKKHGLAGGEGVDEVSAFEEKLILMKKSFPGVNVIYDTTIAENGRYYPQGRNNDGNPDIVINTDLLSKDVAIHEFGHLFLDLLGGMDNSFVKRGRDLLKGSVIEKKVLSLYADQGLTDEEMDLEILATAIGFEGASLFDNQKDSPFKTWLRIFLNKLRLNFGIGGNVALELSRRMLQNEITDGTILNGLSSTIMFSKTMNGEKTTSEEDSKIDATIKKIISRVTVLQKKYRDTSNSEFKDHITQLLKELEDKRDVKGLIRYVDEVNFQTSKIKSALAKMRTSDEDIDAKRLKDIGTFIGAFDLIEEVELLLNDEIEKYERTGDTETVKLLLKKRNLDKAILNLKNINTQYKALEVRALKQIIAPMSNRIKHSYEIKYEREFYSVHGGYKNAKASLGKSLKGAKEEYINTKLADNSEKIQEEEGKYIDRILEVAPKDIGQATSWVVDPKNMDDTLIQSAIEILDKADFKSRQDFLNERDEARDVWNELKEVKGTSDQKKLYKDIIEVIDGKETNYMVGKFKSTYKTREASQYKEWNEREEEGEIISAKERILFYMKLKREELNPQWNKIQNMDDSNPTKKAYLYLTDQARRKDTITPNGYSLGMNIKDLKSNEVTYKLPSIEKTGLERIKEQGLWTAGKEGFKDAFIKDTEDIEFGEQPLDEIDPNLKVVMADEKGKENQKVPIHYRGSLKIASQQSYDLIGISLMDYNNVANYKAKSDVSHIIELLDNRAATREVVKKQAGKWVVQMLNRDAYEPIRTKGINSNVYKALNSIVQDRLYGISSIDQGEILGVNINKASNTIMGWTGHTMLIANYVSGGVNLLQGKFQNFLESTGSKHFSGTNLRKAESLIMKDSAAILGDIKREVPQSKTNLLVEKFNAFGDFSGIIDRYSNDSKLKRSLSMSTGHAINHMGEHYIQSSLMYAVLDSTKVNDGKGGKIALHEAYEMKGKKLQLKEGVVFSEDEVFQVERKIKEVIKQLHGNYDSANKAMAQRYVTGKFAFMLRKWMVVGVQRRWRGIEGASKSKENRTADDVAFNSVLEESAEGYYTTGAKFIRDISSDLRKMQFAMVSGQWNNLTDKERANIKKTIVEISTMLVAVTFSGIMAGLGEDADEEDKEFYYTMAYLSRRFYGELHFYSNPSEAMRMLQTPAASLSMVEKTLDFTSQMFTPAEIYKRGAHKDEYKLIRKGKKLLPVFNQIDRNMKDAYKWIAQ